MTRSRGPSFLCRAVVDVCGAVATRFRSLKNCGVLIFQVNGAVDRPPYLTTATTVWKAAHMVSAWSGFPLEWMAEGFGFRCARGG